MPTQSMITINSLAWLEPPSGGVVSSLARGSIPVLRFANTDGTGVLFLATLPTWYQSTGFSIRYQINRSTDGTDNQNARFEAAFAQPADAITPVFGSFIGADVSLSGTASISREGVITITHVQAGSPSVGEPLLIHFRRNTTAVGAPAATIAVDCWAWSLTQEV